MRSSIPLVRRLYEALVSRRLFTSLQRLRGFADEPQWYAYGAKIKHSFDITASGLSCESSELGLLKCLGESVERYALFSHQKESLLFASLDELQEKAMNLEPYQVTLKNNAKIGWVKGKNLFTGAVCYIPAQLVYLSYSAEGNEPHISTWISTGAAGGSDHQSTLLRGIYEIVERDAFMSTWLAGIMPKQIDIATIPHLPLQRIITKCMRYNLEPYLFETTNDIGIPSYFSLLIDRTGVGPAVSAGFKASTDRLSAIIGSFEEACAVRMWIASEMYKRKKAVLISSAAIIEQLDRGFYWAKVQKIEKLGFLFKQKAAHYSADSDSRNRKKSSLDEIADVLKHKGFSVYYVDITPPWCKKIPYFVYKVIIPQAQPFYIEEAKREIRDMRLRHVASFFGKKAFIINPLPHL